MAPGGSTTPALMNSPCPSVRRSSLHLQRFSTRGPIIIVAIGPFPQNSGLDGVIAKVPNRDSGVSLCQGEYC